MLRGKLDGRAKSVEMWVNLLALVFCDKIELNTIYAYPRTLPDALDKR